MKKGKSKDLKSYQIIIESHSDDTVVKGEPKMRWSIHPLFDEWGDTLPEWDQVLKAVEWAYTNMKRKRSEAAMRVNDLKAEIDKLSGESE